MKPIVIIFSILVFTTRTFSQDYRKLVDSSNKWNYLDQVFTTNGIGEAKTNSLFITNDTLIENICYKKLMSKIIRQTDTTTVFAAGIREDTINQLVYVNDTYNPEELIYSFNHAVGDTISKDTTSYGDACWIRYVKSIGTYAINGFGGKKIEICDTLYHLRPPFERMEVFTDYWYEGIGSLKSVFNLYYIGNLPTENPELLCYWNNGNLIYQSPQWTVCEYAIITAIDDNLIIPDLKIYPNPTTGRLNIFTTTEIKEICLIDMYGKLVFCSPSKNIDLSNLTNGIYLLRIMTESNEIMIKRVIKNAL
jgi:hypothetical protein